ncbi:MAG: hypothetical protein ACK4LB_09290 [Spirosomataceae bacterium]
MRTRKNSSSRKGVCPECKKTIPAGRSDKRFCSDGCRISFNNNRRRLGMAGSGYRVIQQALRLNRDVLSAFHFVNTEWVSKEEMERYGFDFKYFTHLAPNNQGKQLNFVFEFGYEVAQNGYVRLHKDSDPKNELPPN